MKKQIEELESDQKLLWEEYTAKVECLNMQIEKLRKQCKHPDTTKRLTSTWWPSGQAGEVVCTECGYVIDHWEWDGMTKEI